VKKFALRLRTFPVRKPASLKSSPCSGLRRAAQVSGATLVLLALIALPAPSNAQEKAAATTSAPPVVTFTLDFPQSTPTHYSIAVAVDGHARYESTGKIDPDSEEETYQSEFQVSARNRERIFDWAKQAQYFSGKVDSGNGKLAFTGAKVLSYQDGQISNTAHYNYPKLEAVRQLTALFQGMGQTLEYGRRLAYYHRYQKLALDDELKRMEAQAKTNALDEIQGVAPILREIVGDTSVMNVVRVRAQEMIQMGSESAAGR